MAHAWKRGKIPAMARVPLQPLTPAILPSLLQCDFGNLHHEIQRVEAAQAPALHLDVMDGHFVPNLSYGLPIVATIRKLTRLPLDVHLMISNPENFLAEYVAAGADSLTVHFEATSSPETLLRQIRALGVNAGLAINPATSVESLEPYLGDADVLLVMSVQPGFGGQAFQPQALEKLRALRAMSPHALLEIDGGVSEANIAECAAAGADLFVVGSAIFKTPDYSVTIGRMREAIRHGRGTSTPN